MRCTKAAGLAGVVSAALLVGVGGPAGATAGDGVPRIADVQQAVSELAEQPGVVGVIAEAYYDGERIDRGTAGSRLLDGEGGKIPTGSRYRAWSHVKAMTGTVLLQLVDEGRLGVDDKLADVLPIVAEQDLVERADEITIRQLLDMTSGIPDYAGHGDPFDTTYHSPAELVKISRGLPRQQDPGEEYSYSNTNYILLGMIIGKLTGNELAEEFDRRLFGPLKLDRTYLPTKPIQGVKGPHGHGYHPDAQGELRDTDGLNATTPWAAGGLISTSQDLMDFDRILRQDKLLPPELRDLVLGKGRPEDPGGSCADQIKSGQYTGGAGSFSLTVPLSEGRGFSVPPPS